MTRIRIAIGAAEIEYEGDQAFIEGGLLEMAREVLALAGQLAPVAVQTTSSQDTSAVPSNHGLSTNTIAQAIGVKTGSDLAIAAVAKIILVKKKPVAERSEILDEMKEAVTFYKESYSSNLSAYLDTLVKAKRLNLIARGTYGLASGERSRMEQALATAGA